MKYLKLTVIAFLAGTMHSSAQFKLPVNTSIRNDFQKIVSEYTHNFANITGQVINENPQSTEYASQIKLGDAEQCVVTRYSSGSKAIYSWQALMFVTEDFEQASKKYKWLFNQLKGTNVYYVRDQYSLKGTFEPADESRGFTTSTLSISAPPEPLEKLKVEVELLFEFPEWKVSVSIYEKEREDYERGEIAD
jgi:hypothetical protein